MTQPTQILYFAWLRSTLGKASETMTLPEDVTTVKEVLDHLRGRGGAYAEALGTDKVIRVAVNQEHVQEDAPVSPGDEVAIFPPVTGG